MKSWNDPLAALDWMQRHSFAEQEALDARWAGFLSYDLGRLFERLPDRAVDDTRLPLFAFALCRDNAHHGTPPEYPRDDAPLRSTFARDEYLAAVQRCIDYVAAGDVFQINLSQRFSLGLTMSPAEVFHRLVASAPARYGALLEFEDFALICNSPELFLHVTPDRRVVTRPIKGTRPIAPGMEAELRGSLKDQAELNMIVDLERNDLGRVCEIGSVRVTQPRVIEAHPTIYHGAATIEGRLRPDVSLVDLLRATFPGGSVTGAPKIRAMEIIEQFEPVRRGPYCGAIGSVAADGEMIFNVAIRTMAVKTGIIHIPVGGGIVADSHPVAEYDETLVKARAMFAALGVTV
jgi:para-aminobenzoate synthetase component 1